MEIVRMGRYIIISTLLYERSLRACTSLRGRAQWTFSLHACLTKLHDLLLSSFHRCWVCARPFAFGFLAFFPKLIDMDMSSFSYTARISERLIHIFTHGVADCKPKIGLFLYRCLIVDNFLWWKVGSADETKSSRQIYTRMTALAPPADACYVLHLAWCTQARMR